MSSPYTITLWTGEKIYDCSGPTFLITFWNIISYLSEKIRLDNLYVADQGICIFNISHLPTIEVSPLYTIFIFLFLQYNTTLVIFFFFLK